MAKSEVVRLRCADSKKERWQEAADEQGMSLSAWIEDAADAAADFAASPVREDRDTRQDAYLPAEKEREILRLQKLVAKYEGGVRDLSPREVSRSGCTFDTPRGTKCKACGKTH